MNKEDRLKWIKTRHQAHIESDDQFGELPISKREIKETVEEMDSFREFQQSEHSAKETLTSDEV